MKLDLMPPGTWEEYCQKMEQWFRAPEGAAGLRAYMGVAQALAETLTSLAQLFPHKRSLIVVEGASPYLTSPLKSFSKEGYEIKRFKVEDFAEKDWEAEITGDTLFVLLSSDHAVTGERFYFSKLETAASAKRVFIVRLSHNDWIAEDIPELSKFSLQLCVIHSRLCLLAHGARFKAAPMIVQQMYWGEESLPEQYPQHSNINKDSIIEFEESLPEGLCAYLPQGVSRLYDRSVIYTEEMSAEAVIEVLAEKLGVKLPQAPKPSVLDTPNQCRWGEYTIEDWWLHRAPTEDQLRGMLVIDQSLIAQSGFKEKLKESLAEVQSLSTTP